MIDLASIRNASFTLTPTGYNPEEVDRFLIDLADRLAEGLPVVPGDDLQQHLAAEPQAHRDQADVDGLRLTIERTIGAMDAFVNHELASLKAATELETDEIHRERERLLDEAAEAARAHLDETRVRAEAILAEARRDGEALRAGFEGELRAERERFEQSLADRDAQAHARAAEVVADAERRRVEAEELIASANRVQTQVLASLEQARASLHGTEPAAPAEQPVAADAGESRSGGFPGFAGDEPLAADAPATDRVHGANDAAA
jgi:DivIVA domain-containing protein